MRDKFMKMVCIPLLGVLLCSASWMFVPSTATWTPAMIAANMVLGCDASSGVTTGQWNDIWSGNNNHLVAGLTPPSSSTINGKGVLTFDLTVDKFQTAGNTGITGDSGITIVVVAKPSQNVVTYSFGGGGSSGAGHVGYGFYANAPSDVYYGVWGNSGSAVPSTVNTSTATRIFVLSKTAGAMESTTTIRMNGVDVTNLAGAATGTPNFTDSHFVLNSMFADYATEHYQGQIGAVFLFKAALSAPNIVLLETYLNTMFAIY